MNEPADATPVAGVFGWPAEQSRSPRIHGHWLAELGLDGRYERWSVPPDRFAAELDRLRAVPGFRGGNVTLPYKVAALRLCDRVTEAAARIGAVNTLVAMPDGTLEGRNTDGEGFVASLAEAGWVPDRSRTALILGAGGAVRGILAALLAGGLGRALLTNRTAATAEALRALDPARIATVPWEARAEALAGIDLLVNATSLGMTGQPPLLLPLEALPASATIIDIVTSPFETELLRRGRALGHRCVDGLGMLLHQAVPGFAAWFGVRPRVTPAVRAAALAA